MTAGRLLQAHASLVQLIPEDAEDLEATLAAPGPGGGLRTAGDGGA